MRKLQGDFRRIGTMLDCSRNAVMTVETVKKWIDICSDLGYNMLMLYTEDTYEVDKNPYFGYCRGRYSKEELKEIDWYCTQKEMELIPSIQTLAHLNAIVRWPAYTSHIDVNDILLAEDETVYELIEQMFATISECFHSNYVNIGMDEAHLLGRGRYYDLHGATDRYEILIRHLQRVSEIGKRYGLTLCMWADMFYRLSGGYRGNFTEVREEIKEQIPDNVELIYWDYYSHDKNQYDARIKSHEKIKSGIWFAGGFWTWTGFAPHNEFSIRATEAALVACRENGVQDIFFTMWGDNGGECSRFAVLPALFYGAELAKGNTDMEDIKKKFGEKFGISWEDFLSLDLADSPNGDGSETFNSERYLLYNDPFMGLLDSTLSGNEQEGFSLCAEKLRKVSEHPEWGYLFETQRTLCEVLSIKADLGVRTRTAYQSGDRNLLAEVAEDHLVLEEKLEAFYRAFRKQWYRENKGQGFDVQDIRLGGLKQRVHHCYEMLTEYLSGELSHIDELEEQLLDYAGGGGTFAKQPVVLCNWAKNVTANVL